MRLYFICVLLLALGLPQGAYAMKLVCGEKLIQVGDSALYVRKVCGEPAEKTEENRRFDYGGRLERRCFVGDIKIEKWTYVVVFGRVPITLTIVDGEVEGIDDGTQGRRRTWQSPCA